MDAKARYTIDDLYELERKHFGRKAKPDASGTPVLVSPDMAHSMAQGEVIVLLLTWLNGGALPGYMAGPELTHVLDDWLCQPDVSIAHEDGGPYPERAPLLAVEVRSVDNTWREMRAKAARYLEFGLGDGLAGGPGSAFPGIAPARRGAANAGWRRRYRGRCNLARLPRHGERAILRLVAGVNLYLFRVTLGAVTPQEAAMAVRTRYTIEDYIALEGEYPERKFKPDSTGAPVEMTPNDGSL